MEHYRDCYRDLRKPATSLSRRVFTWVGASEVYPENRLDEILLDLHEEAVRCYLEDGDEGPLSRFDGVTVCGERLASDSFDLDLLPDG